MKFKALAAPLALLFALNACATHEESGTLLGAAAGGLIGNQFGKGGGRVAATMAGVLVGGLIGNDIGRRMDDEDRRRAEEAYYEALEEDENGPPREWRNPANGHYGVITPRRVYLYHHQRCREYEQTVYIDGAPQTMTGRACLQPDGSWHQA
jgi:surface antigen